MRCSENSKTTFMLFSFLSAQMHPNRTRGVATNQKPDSEFSFLNGSSSPASFRLHLSWLYGKLTSINVTLFIFFTRCTKTGANSKSLQMLTIRLRILCPFSLIHSTHYIKEYFVYFVERVYFVSLWFVCKIWITNKRVLFVQVIGKFHPSVFSNDNPAIALFRAFLRLD